MKSILPFYGALTATMMLVTYVPAFSLWLPGLFHLETAVGHARVGCDAVGWQGWSREFGQHAARLRNGLRLQAQARPARETTLRAYAREEKQRGQRAAARLNRVRSALTQRVKVVVRRQANIHAV